MYESYDPPMSLPSCSAAFERIWMYRTSLGLLRPSTISDSAFVKTTRDVHLNRFVYSTDFAKIREIPI